jgi:hypothetical protein
MISFDNLMKTHPMTFGRWGAIALFLLHSTIAHATTRYVKPTATGTGDGSSWADASANLQAMINVSAWGDEIWVVAGTYKPTQSAYGSSNPADPRDKTFYLKNGVKLYGGFVGTESSLGSRDWVANTTLLSGDFNDDDLVSGSGASLSIANNSENAYHVVLSVSDGEATVLDGFTITGGHADQSLIHYITVEATVIFTYTGGGICNDDSRVTLSNLTIRGNKADYGGGVSTVNSYQTLTNIVLMNNLAVLQGGGMYNSGRYNARSNSTLINTTLSGNKAESLGGGIFNQYSTLTLIRTTVSDNGAGSHGGGLYGDNSDINMSTCSFKNNGAGTGGAVFLRTGTAQISKCLFQNNTVFEKGGALHTLEVDLNATDCVITGNRATQKGGGVLLESFSTPTKWTNCVISNNTVTVGDGGGIYSDRAASTFINCTLFGNTAAATTGGILCNYSALTLNNCILWGNNALTDKEIGLFLGATATVTYSTIKAATVLAGTGNRNAPPNFVNEADPDGADDLWFTNDDGLRTKCLPTVNGGNNTGITATTDITGAPRIQQSTIDMGAYESASIPTTVSLNVIAPICLTSAAVAPVTFTATGTNIHTYAWNTGENGNSITFTPTASTTYAVTVTGSDGCTATAQQWLDVNTIPPFTITTLNAAYCKTQAAVPLTSTIEGGRFIIDGLTVTQLNPATLAAGNYPVTYEWIRNACTVTRTQMVTILNTPSLVDITGITTACGAVTLTANASALYRYDWNGGLNPTNALNNFHVSGNYQVTVMDGSTSCSRVSAPVSVTVTPNPNTATMNVPPAACGTLTVSVTNSVSAAYTYAWSDGYTPTAATNTFVNPRDYQVTVTNPATGCRSVASAYVPVLQRPNLYLNTEFGHCTRVSLVANSDPSDTYLWNGGLTPTAARNTFLADGNYTVTATGTNGCTSIATTTVLIDPLPVITISGNLSDCPTVSLTASATHGGNQFQWNGGNSPATATNTFTTSGTYIVTVTNGTTQCFDTKTIAVTVGVSRVYVNGSVAASGDGNSWATAFKTLQEAIVVCGAPEIWVAAGTYKPTAYPLNCAGCATNRDYSFTFKDGHKVYGGFPNTGNPSFTDRNGSLYPTILSGDLNGNDVVTGTGSTLSITNNTENVHHIILNYDLHGFQTLLDGFILQGGNANGSGSILVGAYNRTVDRNKGGGMYAFFSNVALERVVFYANSASIGGGAAIERTEDITFRKLIFHHNVATTLSGALYLNNISRTVTVENALFVGNKADQTAGIFVADGYLNVYHSTFFDNMTNNSKHGSALLYGRSGNIKNCIFYKNGRLNVGGASTVYGSSLTKTYNLGEEFTTGLGNRAKPAIFKDSTTVVGADLLYFTADDGFNLQANSYAINTGNGTTPTTDITDFARTGVDMGCYQHRATTSVLPVELVAFKGQKTENGTQLSWQTASETRFAHFDVERSKDGTLFEKIGELKAKGSNSNYTFMDPNPFNVTYYRLKINDLDSKFDYSKIISIEMQSSGGVRVKPTFVNDVLTVEGAASYEIVDGAGRVLLQSIENQLNVQSLPQGFYVVRGRDVGGNPFIQKIIKN